MLRGGCSAICKNKTIIWVIVNNIWQFEKDLLKNQPSVHYYLILCMIIITYIAYGKKRNAEAELSQFNHSIVSSWSSFWKDCDDSTPHKPLLQLNVRSEKCIVVCLKLAGIQVAPTISFSPKCYLVLSIPPILQSTLMWLCVLL